MFIHSFVFFFSLFSSKRALNTQIQNIIASPPPPETPKKKGKKTTTKNNNKQQKPTHTDIITQKDKDEKHIVGDLMEPR